MRWLFRLFMSTNHVKLLELRDLEEETLDIVDKAMQHVRIDQLDMRQDWMDQYLLSAGICFFSGYFFRVKKMCFLG